MCGFLSTPVRQVVLGFTKSCRGAWLLLYCVQVPYLSTSEVMIHIEALYQVYLYLYLNELIRRVDLYRGDHSVAEFLIFIFGLLLGSYILHAARRPRLAC